MRQGWHSEAGNWVSFAGTPGADRAHETINLPAFLELLPPPGRGTLDLACGEGRLSRRLASLGHQVTGFDASTAMAAAAAAHAGAPPVLIADAGLMPFGDDAFDLVVAYMCLHDIDTMPQVVAEAARVLAPGGRICLAIPHPVNTAGAFQSRDGESPFVIASYLDPAPLELKTERLTFHSEHRPLGTYMDALAATGLLTETIREVSAPRTPDRSDPRSRRWQRIPLFLHLRALRPVSLPPTPASSLRA